MAASQPLNLLPRDSYWVFIPLSLIATYSFFFTYKTYDIYDFESLYAHLKQGTSSHLHLKQSDPYKYYYKILAHLASRYPGVHMEYKVTKRTH